MGFDSRSTPSLFRTGVYIMFIVLNPRSASADVIGIVSIKTRSSADADNRLDAFSGQSRSTNMVPFHMLHIVSYCAIVTLSLRHSIFVFKKFHDLEMGVKGHSRSLRVVSFDRLAHSLLSPFVANLILPTRSWIPAEKLIPNIYDKVKYCTHYRNLQYYVNTVWLSERFIVSCLSSNHRG